MDHTEIRQAIAARALRALDAAEAASVEHEILEHVPGCDDCLAMVRDLRAVAADLAIAAEPREVSDDLAARVLDAVRDVPRPAPAARRRRTAWRVVGVAAAAALIASWSVSAVLIGRAARRDAVASVVRVLGDPSAKTVAMRGPAGSLVAGLRADGTLVLLGEGIPDAERGRVLELWLIRGDVPVPVRLVDPDAGSVVLRTAVPPGEYSAVAITSERSFVQRPTTNPVYSGTLGA